jgi:hypothetical protein
MAADQDWCLECGTAAPGRLGDKPGMRAAATVVALTLALVGGAVAASYAALSEDSREAVAGPPGPSGTPVAQAPPATQTAPTGVVAPPASAPPTSPTGPAGVPPIQGVPNTITTPGTSTPPNFTPSITIPTQTTTTPTHTTTTPTQTTPTNTTPTNTTPTTTPTGPQKITPTADFASLYDPYGRAKRKGDPADAYDNNARTNWFVATDDPGKVLSVGLVFDLESAKALERIDLVTTTPGFRVEIYAAESELPPDILDTRWAHLKDRSGVDETDEKDGNTGGDGKERITVDTGKAKYRYVLLWLTEPPETGTTVRLSEVSLYS